MNAVPPFCALLHKLQYETQLSTNFSVGAEKMDTTFGISPLFQEDRQMYIISAIMSSHFKTPYMHW